MSIVFKLLTIAMCVMLVLCLFAYFTGRETAHLSDVLNNVQNMEVIDNSWVDVIQWDIEVEDNSLFQGFVDFVNTFIISPVRVICFIGTGIINALVFISSILYMYFV